jgi:hypothetical protein
VVLVPLEGLAAAYITAGSFEDEVALGLELERRDLDVEIAAAVEQLLAALADRREDAA